MIDFEVPKWGMKVRQHTDPYRLEVMDQGDRSLLIVEGALGLALEAYFESRARMKAKPWLAAIPGETWRLTVVDRDPHEIELTFNVIGVTDVIQCRFARPQVSGDQMEYAIDSEAITSGRRIWPEDAS